MLFKRTYPLLPEGQKRDEDQPEAALGEVRAVQAIPAVGAHNASLLLAPSKAAEGLLSPRVSLRQQRPPICFRLMICFEDATMSMVRIDTHESNEFNCPSCCSSLQYLFHGKRPKLEHGRGKKEARIESILNNTKELPLKRRRTGQTARAVASRQKMRKNACK